MKLLRTSLADLSDDLEAQAQALLRDAFLDGPDTRYDYGSTVPALILLLLDGDIVVGHLAAYERDVRIEEEKISIGLIGGVVIAKEHRSQGYSRALVSEAHRYFSSRGIGFTILFAELPAVYHSSGYRLMLNTTRFLDDDGVWKELVYRGGMVAELTDRRWPDRFLDLCGSTV